MTGIPAGVIIGWPNSAASIPAGWTRVAALDGLMPRPADAGHDAGAAGGTAAHTHASTPHSHGAGFSHSHSGGGPTAPLGDIIQLTTSAIPQGDGNRHTHTIPPALAATADLDPYAALWSAVNVGPPAYTVIWLQSDGTPTGFPSGALGYWSDGSIPSGLTQHAASEGRYLVGAAAGADGGATAGGATHTHAAIAHSHTSEHQHPMASTTTTGATQPVTCFIGSSSIPLYYVTLDTPVPGHTHSTSLRTSTLTTDPTTSANTGAAAINPPNIGVAVVQVTSGAPRRDLGFLCPFIGPLADIPFGWALADGTGGTLDVRGSFLLPVTSLGDIGTTAGAIGHGHSDPADHDHTENGHHEHPLSGVGNAHLTGFSVALRPGFVVNPFGGADTIVLDHTHADLLTGDSSVASATTATDGQDVQDVAEDRPPFLDVLLLSAPGTLVLTIDDPAPNAVVTVNNPLFDWHWSGTHTQVSFHMVITEADGVTVAYDSGVVATALAAHTVPAGHLHTARTYHVSLEVLTVDRFLGDAGPVTFTTVFAPSPPPADLTATPEDAGEPPYVLLGWTEGTLSSGQTYLSTLIERRIAGSGDPWQPIGTVPLITTLSYRDYTAQPGTSYEYAVVTVTDYGGDTLHSVEHTPAPTAELTFLDVWLHLAGDPTVNLRMISGGGSTQPAQDAAIVPGWGRELPTVHVGELVSQQWTFVGVWSLFPGYPNAPDPLYGGPDPWSRFIGFLRAAKAGGAAGTLCVRYGANREGGFGVIITDNSSRADDVSTYQPTIVIQQVYFDETPAS